MAAEEETIIELRQEITALQTALVALAKELSLKGYSDVLLRVANDSAHLYERNQLLRIAKKAKGEWL